jgi:hypothetical protein
MFSQQQIKKAESCQVSLVSSTAREDTFKVVRFVKHRKTLDEKREYSVILLNGKGLKLIDRFLGAGCDCQHFTLGTLHGDKLCSHCISVIFWLADNGKIDRGWKRHILEMKEL